MRYHNACAVLLLVMAGCGDVQRGVAVERPPLADSLLDLVDRLPAGADRCVFLRPSLVPSAQRELLVPISAANPVFWLQGGPFASVATVWQSSFEGTAMIALASTPSEPVTVRTFLEAHSPVEIAWGPCEGRCPGFVADFPDGGVLRLRSGEWSQAPVGVERDCERLARAAGGAVEVSAGDTERDGYARRRIELGQRGVIRVRMLDSTEWVAPGEALPSTTHRTNEALLTRIEEWFSWEDLALAAEDRRAFEEALVRDMVTEDLVPPDEVDMGSSQVLGVQLGAWTRALGRARGVDRQRIAAGLATLLERSLSAYPEELARAESLAKLYLDDLSRPDRALSVVDRALALPPPDLEHWRQLRREIESRLGPDVLARSLVVDQIVAPRWAARVAADLCDPERRDVDYALREGAWGALTDVVALRPHEWLRVAPATLPRRSLWETLDVVIDISLSGTESPAVMFSRVVRSSSDLGIVGAPFAEWREGERVAVVLPGLSERDGSASVTEGPVEVVVFEVVSLATVWRPVFGFRGRVTGDDVVIERVVGSARVFDWGVIARYVGRPLAGHDLGGFPSGTVQFEALTAEDGEQIVNLSREDVSIVCEQLDRVVRCESPRGDPIALRAFMLRVGARFMGEGAQRLWTNRWRAR